MEGSERDGLDPNGKGEGLLTFSLFCVYAINASSSNHSNHFLLTGIIRLIKI